MRKLAVVLGLLIVLMASATASAGSFNLQPGDPHWVKKEDPSGVLFDMGEYWLSSKVTGQKAPKIYFKLPEVANAPGILTFYYGKDVPRSWGWDKIILYASKDGVNYQKIWESPAWGYVEKRQVLVNIPAGYQYLYFLLSDGNLKWEEIRLWKPMMIISTGPPTTPTPTPTPTPVTPSQPPAIPGFEAVFAIAGLLAVAYLLRRGA